MPDENDNFGGSLVLDVENDDASFNQIICLYMYLHATHKGRKGWVNIFVLVRVVIDHLPLSRSWLCVT